MKTKYKLIICAILALQCLAVGIILFVYWIYHPDLTKMQMFLKFWWLSVPSVIGGFIGYWWIRND